MKAFRPTLKKLRAGPGPGSNEVPKMYTRRDGCSVDTIQRRYIMRRIASVFVFLSFILLLCSAAESQPPPAFYGQVLKYNPYGRHFSYPYLEVVLVDRVKGPSRPKFTDQNGFYYFHRLPSCNDDYLLEVYEDGIMIYRKVIRVRGCPYAHPPIVLP